MCVCNVSHVVVYIIYVLCLQRNSSIRTLILKFNSSSTRGNNNNNDEGGNTQWLPCLADCFEVMAGNSTLKVLNMSQ
jgi:hypothetical protein